MTIWKYTRYYNKVCGYVCHRMWLTCNPSIDRMKKKNHNIIREILRACSFKTLTYSFLHIVFLLVEINYSLFVSNYKIFKMIFFYKAQFIMFLTLIIFKLQIFIIKRKKRMHLQIIRRERNINDGIFFEKDYKCKTNLLLLIKLVTFFNFN